MNRTKKMALFIKNWTFLKWLCSNEQKMMQQEKVEESVGSAK